MAILFDTSDEEARDNADRVTRDAIYNGLDVTATAEVWESLEPQLRASPALTPFGRRRIWTFTCWTFHKEVHIRIWLIRTFSLPISSRAWSLTSGQVFFNPIYASLCDANADKIELLLRRAAGGRVAQQKSRRTILRLKTNGTADNYFAGGRAGFGFGSVLPLPCKSTVTRALRYPA